MIGCLISFSSCPSVSSVLALESGGTLGAFFRILSTTDRESAINSSVDVAGSRSEGVAELAGDDEAVRFGISTSFSLLSCSFTLSKSRRICSLKLNFSSSLDFSVKSITSLLTIPNIIS